MNKMKNSSSETITVEGKDNKPITLEMVNVEIDEEESCCAKFCCICSCCRNDEVREARKDLSGIITDWIVDTSVASYHVFMRHDLLAGILTYAIVFHAGLIITFINIFPSKHYKNEVRLTKSEIWKMNKFYGLLMYVPSFFPICSAKLRLEFAKQLRECKARKKNLKPSEEEMLILKIKMKMIKEKALWDKCCEAFLEAFPQAVLQLVLLLIPSKRYNTVIDYFPILTVFLSVYGITGAPIAVLSARDPKLKWSLFEKLTACAGNALRVFSSAMFIVSVLSFAKTEDSSTWITTLWIAFAAIIIFGLMAGLYIMKFEVDKCLNKKDVDCHCENAQSINGDGQPEVGMKSRFRKKCPDTVVSVLGLVLTILGFYLWVASQILPLGVMQIDTFIVIGCFTVLMIVTCAGIAVHRHKLGLYHNVAADVPLSAYKGVKAFVGNVFKKLTCT